MKWPCAFRSATGESRRVEKDRVNSVPLNIDPKVLIERVHITRPD